MASLPSFFPSFTRAANIAANLARIIWPTDCVACMRRPRPHPLTRLPRSRRRCHVASESDFCHLYRTCSPSVISQTPTHSGYINSNMGAGALKRGFSRCTSTFFLQRGVILPDLRRRRNFAMFWKYRSPGRSDGTGKSCATMRPWAMGSLLPQEA